ncbi:GNAT family N-acetyltransferase [Desulfosediminicola sp.]|uniref:GNAT family N-acetyltransferase n=1 Tax=Desulfosediminicola sp. TaxID=2886825 RepID=UPI003AF23BB3
MNIRNMAPEDCGAISIIEQESPSPWTPAQILAELPLPESIVLVSTGDDGNINGWCCSRYCGPEAELLKIAVAGSERRKGVAKKLLRVLIKKLAAVNVSILFLEVRSKNEPACKFYCSQGFAQVGERAGYYANPRDNALIYRKELLYIDG